MVKLLLLKKSNNEIKNLHLLFHKKKEKTQDKNSNIKNEFYVKLLYLPLFLITRLFFIWLPEEHISLY